MEEITKSKSLKRREISETVQVSEQVTPLKELDSEVVLALHCAAEKKAVGTIVLDLREITSFTEFFIVTSGTNQRQVRAISDEISEQLRKQEKVRAIRIEGYSSGDWILLDYGDFVVHIFSEKSREFYDLERLWRDAKRVELPERV